MTLGLSFLHMPTSRIFFFVVFFHLREVCARAMDSKLRMTKFCMPGWVSLMPFFLFVKAFVEPFVEAFVKAWARQ